MTEQKDMPQQEEDWAYGYPARETRLIREHIKIIPGYDLEKVLKGQIIERIMWDDTNSFTSAVSAFNRPDADAGLADPNRKVLLRRMQWELDQTFTPARIKESIEKVSKIVEVSEWKTKDDVLKARAVWEKEVRGSVLEMLDANEERVKDAREEYRKFFDEVSARGLPH